MKSLPTTAAKVARIAPTARATALRPEAAKQESELTVSALVASGHLGSVGRWSAMVGRLLQCALTSDGVAQLPNQADNAAFAASGLPYRFRAALRLIRTLAPAISSRGSLVS